DSTRWEIVMSFIRMRHLLALGTGGVKIICMLLLTLLLRNAYGADAQAPASVAGPFVGAPTSPASLDVTRLPHDGGLNRPHKPFLHPRGKKSLDEEKAETPELGPGVGIEAFSWATPSPLASSLGIGFD